MISRQGSKEFPFSSYEEFFLVVIIPNTLLKNKLT